MDTYWAVVVAQLVNRSLPTPEVRGSNQVIGEVLFIINCIEKTKIKKRKRDREWPINKKNNGHIQNDKFSPKLLFETYLRIVLAPTSENTRFK